MSSRVGIVLQAIGVIALGSVVYLVFLSPEDPDPLTGIEIEDGVRLTPPQITGTGRHARRNPDLVKPKRNRAQRYRAQRNRAQRHRPRRAATFPRLVATPPPSSAVPLPSTKPGVTAPIDTPSDSQYSDTVSRILHMVGDAQP